MPSVSSVSQEMQPGASLALYRLDATKVKAGVHYFCKAAEDGTGVVFGGQEYLPIDIQVSEFKVNAGGALPQPKMRIANSDLMIQSLVNAFGDLAGCELRRVRVFERFLDGRPDADPTAFIGPDVFLVERKSDENELYIEWELSAAIDQEGKMIPGRQFIRDICTRRYRIYDPTSPDAGPDGFVYSKVFPCPYTGTACFTALGEETTPQFDACGRKISDCDLRFHNDGALPTAAFPGIARVQQ